MARGLHKLTARAVNRAKARSYLCDGGGLYLQISSKGAKSWVFRFREHGRLREMGLGSLKNVSLATARDKAAECRARRGNDLDPIEIRRGEQAQAKLDAARAITFRQCAEAYIEAHKAGWKNEKHAAQWPATLKTYAHDVIGDLPVQAIDTALVTKVLEPIWKTKTETASRLRGRIEAVLDWAKARGYRQGDNPARWRGHLDHLLPQRSKVQKTKHHAALPYTEIGGFMQKLRDQDGVSALALELLILTAARTGEVIEASWGEIDLDAALWTIPAHRMKSAKEHRVPLSKPALTILKGLRPDKSEPKPGQFVFLSGTSDRPLSNMAMLKVLERMNRADLTVHGFRSTFRDWAAERTNFAREVCEQALAHSLPDKVEAAYRRGDLFDKRRKLMDAWARYCATVEPSGAVISIDTKNKYGQANQ